MSLIEPVELVRAEQAGALHFIAIGGAGMSGVASAYFDRGSKVSGCDKSDSATIRDLAAAGIQTHIGHDISHLDGIDTVVVSSAIRVNNPELLAAKQRGIRIWHRSAALAALMLDKIGISIAGSHGKTTTSAITACMLEHAGVAPSYVIGAPLAATGKSSHLGSGNIFVVEADESDGTFLQYPTQIAVITNVEPDHLDNWETADHYQQGFYRFATGPEVETVVICIDDEFSHQLATQLRKQNRKVITYGICEQADIRLTNLDFLGTNASAILHAEGQSYHLQMQVPGKHNLLNAAAAFAVGRSLNLDADVLLAGAQAFTGTLRRFQLIGRVEMSGGQVLIFDDYAHHPTELRAALSAAKKVSPGARLVACFQPHLYSRTQNFAKEFGEALAYADVVVVTDIYAAREDPISGVSGQLVAQAAIDAGAKEVHYVANKIDLPDKLANIVAPNDLVMTLGAGDVTLVGPLVLKQLTK